MKISDHHSFSSFKTLPGCRTRNVDVYLKSLDISKQRSTILSRTELLFVLKFYQTAGYLGFSKHFPAAGCLDKITIFHDLEKKIYESHDVVHFFSPRHLKKSCYLSLFFRNAIHFIIIIIILLKFKFGRFFKFTQPAYSIANRGGLYNLQ